MMARWRRHLPPAPVLPRSLWLTGGALLLALLSYGFRAELWPGHPAAGARSLGLLPLLVVAGLLQLLQPLCRWLAAVALPRWLRWVLQFGLVLVRAGTFLLIGLLLLGFLLVLAVLG